jgi:hypothetical protein
LVVLTIQWTPNLSVNIPKVSPQNCLAKGMSTCRQQPAR